MPSDRAEPSAAELVDLAAGFDLARGGHDLDHAEDGVHGDPGAGEVDDSVFGDPIALVGYADVVGDFIDRASIRSC